ncbi:MAG: hypothetical protein KDM91_03775 [Verrucomicrobiae bacterium]|nr:hypothetical protein [Verrucomicrobiae bacterium]MCP5540765.1 hypothetical protein [Akkermansiaceae bacterium]
MPERPPIRGHGRVVAERIPGRLYEIEMPNGFRTLGIPPKEGFPDRPGDSAASVGDTVAMEFSAYDMSSGRMTALGKDAPIG